MRSLNGLSAVLRNLDETLEESFGLLTFSASGFERNDLKV
jgi:hypothetical protein